MCVCRRIDDTKDEFIIKEDVVDKKTGETATILWERLLAEEIAGVVRVCKIIVRTIKKKVFN